MFDNYGSRIRGENDGRAPPGLEPVTQFDNMFNNVIFAKKNPRENLFSQKIYPNKGIIIITRWLWDTSAYFVKLLLKVLST